MNYVSPVPVIMNTLTLGFRLHDGAYTPLLFNIQIKLVSGKADYFWDFIVKNWFASTLYAKIDSS